MKLLSNNFLVSHFYLNKNLKECRVEIRDFIYSNLHEQSKERIDLYILRVNSHNNITFFQGPLYADFALNSFKFN